MQLFHSLAETPQIFPGRCCLLRRRSARAMGRFLLSRSRVKKVRRTRNDPRHVANRLHADMNESQEAALLSRDDAIRFRTRADVSGRRRFDFRCACCRAAPASRTATRCDRTSGSLGWTPGRADRGSGNPDRPSGSRETDWEDVIAVGKMRLQSWKWRFYQGRAARLSPK